MADGAGGAGGSDDGAGGAGGNDEVNWLSGSSEESQGYIENKGWENLDAMVQSQRNLETKIGVPADRLLTLPSQDAEAGEWDAVHNKLGRPENAAGYELGTLQEKGDEDFLNGAGDAFHKLGISKTQAQGVVKWYNEFAEGRISANGEAAGIAAAEEKGKLAKDWGAAADQNMRIARGAANKFGVPGEVIDTLQNQIGYADTMKFFANIGTALGEDNFAGGEQDNGFGDVMSPAAAQAKIDELKGDKDFTKRYLSGDVAAMNKMHTLQKFAAGGK